MDKLCESEYIFSVLKWKTRTSHEDLDFILLFNVKHRNFRNVYDKWGSDETFCYFWMLFSFSFPFFCFIATIVFAVRLCILVIYFKQTI